MEKICIVKLRKKLANLRSLKEEGGQGIPTRESLVSEGLTFTTAGVGGTSEVLSDGRGVTDTGKEGGVKTISLVLSQEQRRSLRSNPYLASLLNGQTNEGFEAGKHQDEPIVIKLEFNTMAPMRLLNMEETARMLRISKSYLKKVLGRGTLRSYKLGRLRRIRLDDLLSYLEDHLESPNSDRQAPSSIIACNEML